MFRETEAEVSLQRTQASWPGGPGRELPSTVLGMCGVRAGSRAQVDSQQVAELRSVIPPPSPTQFPGPPAGPPVYCTACS